MPLDFTYASKDGQAVITVFVPGQDPKVLDSDNPNFNALWEGLRDGTLSEREALVLTDVEKGLASRFERVSERLTLANRQLYFDGDPIDNAISREIIRVMEENGSIRALVAFFEKVQTNPLERSREELYTWVKDQGLTIVDSDDETCGDIIGYKGGTNGPDGIAYSQYTGRAIVNGEVIEGKIPYPVGGIVEMPRSEVVADGKPCNHGIHVGNFEYALAFAKPHLFEVRVNPRDVVNVPRSENKVRVFRLNKMRVCRLRVIQPIEEKYRSATVRSAPMPAPTPVALNKPHVPTDEEWKTMVDRAKRRRNNFQKYASTVGGWTFSKAVSADPKDPKSWRVPPVKADQS